MTWNLLISMLVLVLAALFYVRARVQRERNLAGNSGTYSSELVLCERRLKLLGTIQSAFPSQVVMANVPASALVTVRGGSRLALKRDVLRRTLLDFVVLDGAGMPCHVFRVGRSTDTSTKDAYSEDAFVARALHRARINLFKISRLSSKVTHEQLREVVAWSLQTRVPSGNPAPVLQQPETAGDNDPAAHARRKTTPGFQARGAMNPAAALNLQSAASMRIH